MEKHKCGYNNNLELFDIDELEKSYWLSKLNEVLTKLNEKSLNIYDTKIKPYHHDNSTCVINVFNIIKDTKLMKDNLKYEHCSNCHYINVTKINSKRLELYKCHKCEKYICVDCFDELFLGKNLNKTYFIVFINENQINKNQKEKQILSKEINYYWLDHETTPLGKLFWWKYVYRNPCWNYKYFIVKCEKCKIEEVS